MGFRKSRCAAACVRRKLKIGWITDETANREDVVTDFIKVITLAIPA